ncbi:MAG TPA: hypothetical protein VH394_00175 [Thermoanaerobaculia bacterium]|jgi:hypothetical protein|nr:hypothetical protein [Thermoanaerobaculia bacterium]
MPGEQLNKVLGENTAQFHLDGTMPNPGAADLDNTGGTPNQKTERWANRIALYHFVDPNAGKAKKALEGTIEHFEGQVANGHQCVGKEDEALTLSHAPIWWRAIMSLRITTNRLAGRGSDYAHLEQLVLDWLEFHTTLNSLGQIKSGPKAGEIWVPGARTKLKDGSGEKKTETVTNVIHQLMTTDEKPDVSKKFFALSQDAPDRAGAALAKQIKDTIGFGDVTGGRMPKLRNRLVFESFDDGHVGRYPDGIAKDNGHVRQAWAQYSTGRIDCTREIEPLPDDVIFQGNPRTREIEAA